MVDRSRTRRAGWLALACLACFAPGAIAQPPEAKGLPRIVPSRDRSHFVREGTDERVEMWGFNYDHDADGRLLEDYWEKEWDAVAGDFREMKALGANVVRIHLQTGRFLASAERP